MFTIIIKNAAAIQDRSSMTSRLTLRSLTEDAGDALVQTLAESRERWRMLVAESADLVFETDEAGRLVLLAPEVALGWPVTRLIGEPAASLLLQADDASREATFNPFETKQAVRGRRVWWRTAGGGPVCMLVCAAPIAGRPGAVRGLGIDVTEQEQGDAARAASLAQHEAARALAFRMRDAALPFASLTAGLEELARMIDGDGASVLLHEPARPLRVAATAGKPWPGVPQALHDEVIAACGQAPTWLVETSRRSESCGQSLLLCTGANHFADRAVLAVWRKAAPWKGTEVATAEALLQAVQPILEHEQIQRETARLSRTDFLTGLFNRQGFVAELSRRFDRLDREGHPAALMLVGLDKLASVNAGFGVESGDQALEQAALLLRNGVRPTDLVARMGGDLFGLWLDNADQFTSAERADHLVRAGIDIDQETTRITLSVGIAIRASRSFESIDSLLYRAFGAMQASKRAGGGRWLVSNAEPSP